LRPSPEIAHANTAAIIDRGQCRFRRAAQNRGWIGCRAPPDEFAYGVDRGDFTMNHDKELDARGLSCPLPILKTKKALNELTSGQVLKVIATDPGSVKDMQAFSTQTGNPLLSQSEENKDYVFYLKKK
jgi:tRNA 2-thiouridine synthesizing protein A